jgi:hypothetical protein
VINREAKRRKTSVYYWGMGRKVYRPLYSPYNGEQIPITPIRGEEKVDKVLRQKKQEQSWLKYLLSTNCHFGKQVKLNGRKDG